MAERDFWTWEKNATNDKTMKGALFELREQTKPQCSPLTSSQGPCSPPVGNCLRPEEFLPRVLCVLNRANYNLASWKVQIIKVRQMSWHQILASSFSIRKRDSLYICWLPFLSWSLGGGRMVMWWRGSMRKELFYIIQSRYSCKLFQTRFLSRSASAWQC